MEEVVRANGTPYRSGVPESDATGSGELPADTIWVAYLLIAEEKRGVRLGTIRAKTEHQAQREAALLYQVPLEEVEVERQ